MENVREDCFPCGGGIGYRLRRKTVVEKGSPSKQQSFFAAVVATYPAKGAACCQAGCMPWDF